MELPGLIERVTWAQIKRDFLRLAPFHFAEVEDGRFNLSAAFYEAVDKAGMLACFRVRKHHLIGYNLLLVTDRPHTGEKVALCDAVYLLPRYRGCGYGQLLLFGVEEMLKADGVVSVTYGVRPTRDFSGTLKRGGYSVTETHYIKRL